MRRESGATMTEYVLMVSLIAIALVVAIVLFQGALTDNLADSADCISGIAGGNAGGDCPGSGAGTPQP